MKLVKIAKDGNSRDGSCPAVYQSPDDAQLFVVQGKVLDVATFESLADLADDETGVAIPVETVLRGVDTWVAANPDLAAAYRTMHAEAVAI